MYSSSFWMDLWAKYRICSGEELFDVRVLVVTQLVRYSPLLLKLLISDKLEYLMLELGIQTLEKAKLSMLPYFLVWCTIYCLFRHICHKWDPNHLKFQTCCNDSRGLPDHYQTLTLDLGILQHSIPYLEP